MPVCDYKIWVMDFTGGVPVFDSALWREEKRLIPKRHNNRPGAAGAASFRVLRRARYDSASEPAVSTWFPIRGQYVAITSYLCPLPGQTGTFFVGCFDSLEAVPFKGRFEEIGQATAREVGYILDQVPVANLCMYDGLPLLTNPNANEAGLVQGEIIGNMMAGSDGNMQFAKVPTDLGTAAGNYWTRYDLIRTVLAYSVTGSPKIPAMSLNSSSAITTLLQEQIKEVIELRGLTIKGLLDLLCGASRGLYWNVKFSGSTWQIWVYSGIDITVGTIPAAPLTAVTLANEENLAFNSGGVDMYDAVEVAGNRIVHMGTTSLADGTMAAGWSATQLTQYLTGASGAAGYAALTAEQKVARNRAVRRSGVLCDVYTRYMLFVDAATDFRCKGVSGAPGATVLMCPEISWSGTAASANYAISRSPYPAEARLQRLLPWPSGLKGDGTDTRQTEQKTRPNYLPPIVLSNLVPGAPMTWCDLLNPPLRRWSKPTISIDQRGPGLRIEYEYPETLAYGAWSGSGAALSEFDPDLTSSYGSFAYGKLICTVAMEADQRVRVVKYKTGYSATNVRNVLRIHRSDLNCWFVHRYSIVGLKDDGTPDEVSADQFLRNDFAVAEKLANELAAFAFRSRLASVITLVTPYLPPAWAQIGTMLGVVTDGAATYSLNTFITNLEFNWSETKPRLIVTTSEPPIPDSLAIAPIVPGMGGTVSTSLGGTMPSVIQTTQSEVRDLQKAVSSTPVIPGKSPHIDYVLPQTYGRVRWNFTSFGVDACECQITDSAGANASPTTIGWIDGFDALKRNTPDAFGDVYYVLEDTGTTVTRAAVTRELYRIVRRAGIVAGTRLYELEDSGTSTIFYVRDIAGRVTTTINGVASNNLLHTQKVLASLSGQRWDAQLPVRVMSYVDAFGAVYDYPSVVPDILQTSRRRSGRAVASASGAASATLSSLSIDLGEYFELTILATQRANSGTVIDAVAFSHVSIGIYSTATGVVAVYGIKAEVAIGAKVSTTTATTSAQASGTVTGASASTTVLTVTNTPGNGTSTCTVTFTFDATTARITTIAVANSGANDIAVSVDGGRPVWQVSGFL